MSATPKPASPGMSSADAACIEAAETAVSMLTDAFRRTALGALDQIEALRAEALEDPAASAGAFERIGDIAHDLKGQGASFDYPLVTCIADLLCDFVREQSADPAATADYVERCRLAMFGVLHHGVQGDGDDTGAALLEALGARA